MDENNTNPNEDKSQLNPAPTTPSTEQPTPVVQDQLTSINPYEQPQKKKLPLKKFIPFLVLALFIVLGAGGYAYYSTLNNSSEKVLADAISTTAKDILDRKPLELAGLLTVESTDPNSPYKVVVDMNAKQVNDNGEVTTKVQFTYGDTLDLNIDANIVSEGSTAVYIKLNNLMESAKQLSAANPEFGQYVDMVEPVLKKIDGKWIQFSEKDVSAYGGVDSEEVSKCSTAFDALRISDADKNNMKDIFARNQFAIATEELSAEEVNGDASFHYKLDLNEEPALAFAKEVIKLESFKQVATDCEITDQVIEDNIKSNEADEEVKSVFELWVSKETRRITKARITSNDQSVTMDSITTVSIDNQDLTVTIPTEFMTLDELQKEINQIFGTAQELNARYNR